MLISGARVTNMNLHLHMRGGQSIPMLKTCYTSGTHMDESSDTDMLTEMVKSRMFLEFQILAP